MRRSPVALALVLVLASALLPAAPARAETGPEKDALGYLYWSPGMDLTLLGSVRFGGANWEFGLLATGDPGYAVGFDKSVWINSWSRAEFGPVWLLGSSVGLYGSIGADWRLWHFLGVRLEAGGVGVINNDSYGFVQAGAELHL